MRHSWVSVLGSSLLFWAGAASAQTQVTVPVQGVLADASGAPISMTVPMRFSLYASSTAMTALWSEVQQVAVGEVFPGVYTVRLGTVTALGAELFRDNPGIHFGVRIGSDTVDVGRWPIDNTPKSAHAQIANDATMGGGNTAATDPLYVNVTGDTMTGPLALPQGGLRVGTNSLVVDNAGQVGVGILAPGARLEVAGGATRLDARSAAGLRLDLAGTTDLLIREVGGANDTVAIGDALRYDTANGRLGIGRQPSTVGNIRLDVEGEIGIGGQAIAAVETANNIRTLFVGDYQASDGALENLAFRVADRTAVSITSAGNVGIGVAPDARLTVQGAAAASSLLLNVRSGASRDLFRVNADANGHALVLIKNGAELDRISLSAGGDSYFNAGNVAIGRTTASHRLHVEGSVSGTSLCIGSDCRTSWAAVTGDQPWQRNGSGVQLAAPGDYVAIGRATPLTPLHVDGIDGRFRPMVISGIVPSLYFWDTEADAMSQIISSSFGIEVDSSMMMIGSRQNTASTPPFPATGTQGTTRSLRIMANGDVAVNPGNFDVNGSVSVGRSEANNATAYNLQLLRNGTAATPGAAFVAGGASVVDNADIGPATYQAGGLLSATYARILDGDTNARNAAMLVVSNNSGSGLRVSGQGNTLVGYSGTAEPGTLRRSLAVEGRVGVGTIDPQTPLHVAGISRFDDYATYGGSFPNHRGHITWSTANQFIVRGGAGQELSFGADNGSHININTNGNVAIGRSVATQKLQVEGAINGTSLCIAGQCFSSWGAVAAGTNAWLRDGATGSVYPSTIGDRIGIGTARPDGGLALVTNNSARPLLLHSATSYEDVRQFGTRIHKEVCVGGFCDHVPLVIQTQYGSTWHDTAYFSDGRAAVSPSLRTYSHTQLATDGGNVGIGTRTPTDRLQVSGNMRLGVITQIADTLPPQAAGTGNFLYFSGGPDMSSVPGNAGWDSDNSDPLYLARYNFGNNASELRMVIGDDDGDVDRFTIGIAAASFVPKFSVSANGAVAINKLTVNPNAYTSGGARLDVEGGIALRGNTLLSYDGGTNFYVGDIAGGDGTVANLRFRTNDADRMVLNGSGNLGIGNPDPQFRLDVNGTVRIGGFSSANALEWPNVVWNRDIPNGWDEGLIKIPAANGPFGRGGFGIHMHNTKEFTMMTTNLTPLWSTNAGTGDMWVRGRVHHNGVVGRNNYQEFVTTVVDNAPNYPVAIDYNLMTMRCSYHWGSYYVEIDLVTYYYHPSVRRYKFFCGNGNNTSGGNLVEVVEADPFPSGTKASLTRINDGAIAGTDHSGSQMYQVRLRVSNPSYVRSYARVRAYGWWPSNPAGSGFSNSEPSATWHTWNP